MGYHGRTGKVFHVVNRAVGVLINKQVRHRIMTKRIYVRTEHLVKSKCRANFIKRVKENKEKAEQAKKSGKKVVLKRQPKAPKEGFMVVLDGGKKVTPLKIRAAVE